jgi:predicted DNA-binding transcriptional regulator AlpA
MAASGRNNNLQLESEHSPPAGPAPGSLLLTARDLAALLGTTPRQIANMVARGQAPASSKIPGLGRRWHRHVVERWLAELPV